MDRRRRWGVGKAAALLLVVAAPPFIMPGTAGAVFDATAFGSGRAATSTVPSPAKPAVNVIGQNATVSWTATQVAPGAGANRYTVRRYTTSGGLSATLSNCATGAALSCVDSGVANGSYLYTVAAGYELWNGPESTFSDVTVVGPAFTITSATTVSALPSVVTGTVTNFTVGATLTFRLDSPTGPILSSSPAIVSGTPSQAVTVTLPNGTTDGAHTIHVIGSDTRQASAALTVAAPPKLLTLVMSDANGNGRVDRVVATFDETLAAYTAGTAPWTLTNVPSAGMLASVAVAGNQATLTITEGVNAADTAVGSFTIALASHAAGIRDAAGNPSSFAATAPSDGARPVPMTITDTDGATNGLFEQGDTISITFSEPLLASTVPTTATLTLADGAADTLTISGVSAANRSLGSSGYISNNRTATFTGSAVARSNGNRTVTVTVGTCTTDCTRLTTQTTPATYSYLAAATLTDPAGNASTTVTTVSIRLF